MAPPSVELNSSHYSLRFFEKVFILFLKFFLHRKKSPLLENSLHSLIKVFDSSKKVLIPFLKLSFIFESLAFGFRPFLLWRAMSNMACGSEPLIFPLGIVIFYFFLYKKKNFF